MQQGQKADYIYVVKKGEVRTKIQLVKQKSNKKQIDAKKILEQPWQANSQNCEHMKKNMSKDFDVVDLGIIGRNIPLGFIEAV